MDFLNKAYGQITDLLKSMTPAARITTGLLLAVLVVSLAYLFQHDPKTTDEYLFGAMPLTNREIATMQVAFSKNGLNGYEVYGNRIRVSKSQRHAYMNALSEHNAMPEHSDKAWADLFNSQSPLDPRNVQEQKFRYTQERVLGNQLRDIKGIEEASVTIDEKQTGTFPPRSEKSALAAVRAAGNSPIDASLIKAVRHTVAAGGGLDGENVTVLDKNTGAAYPGGGKGDGLLGEENAYAENQQRFERKYKRSIEDRLSYIQGVKVGVSVDLDKNLKNQSSSHEYQTGAQVRSSEYRQDLSSTQPQRGGRPGAVPNGVLGNTAQTVSERAPAETRKNEERSELENIPAATHTFTELAPLVPERVTASVAVPTSYFEKIWRQENPVLPGEEPQDPDPAELEALEQREIAKIQSAIELLLPSKTFSADAPPKIDVSTYTETPLPPAEGPGIGEKLITWFGTHWQTLGMFALAVGGVLLLRSMVRSAQNAALAAPERPLDERQTAVPEGDHPLEDEEEDDSSLSNTLKARFQSPTPSLRDELAELVREDPDAAASVLENWIGDAA